MTRHPWVAAADEGLRWGLQLVVPDRPGALPALLETGRTVERLGFDLISIFDHPAITADPWIALSGLAAVTSRVRLGSTVNCGLYRQPAHLARLAADLDDLSRGRALLGIGSGWWEAEFAGLGLPFPSLPERQAALDEALQIITGLQRDPGFTFSGRHYATTGISLKPGPVQERLPIMIGGSGEKVTLRQVAQYGDACNVKEEVLPSDTTASDADRAANVARKLAALDRHCHDLGRDPREVLRTHFSIYLMLAPTEAAAAAKLAAFDTSQTASPGTRRAGKASVFCASPERAIAYYQAMADVGIQYFIVQLEATDHETINLLAEHVVPAVTGKKP